MNTNKRQKNNMGLIIALMTGYSLVYMDKTMVSTTIIPLAKQFALNAGQTGWIISSFFLGYSLMQIPSGWLADKIGAKKVLMLSLVAVAVFSIAFGGVGSLMLFIIIRFFAGIGHSGYQTSCSKSIAENYPQAGRTFIQAPMLSTSGIGGILAFVIGTTLIDINWRLAYIVLGGMFLAAFILVWIFVPNKIVLPKKENQIREKVSFLKVVTNPSVITLAFALLFLNFLLYGTMTWIPSYLNLKFNLEIRSIGYLLAINAILQTVAILFVGKLLSRFFLNKERIFILVSTIITASLICLVTLSKHLVLSMILLMLIGLLAIGAFTAIFTWPHKIIDSKSIGSSIGIISTGGTLGGFLAPILLGKLIEIDRSFSLAFISLAIASLLCGVTVLLISKEKNKTK